MLLSLRLYPLLLILSCTNAVILFLHTLLRNHIHAVIDIFLTGFSRNYYRGLINESWMRVVLRFQRNKKEAPTPQPSCKTSTPSVHLQGLEPWALCASDAFLWGAAPFYFMLPYAKSPHKTRVQRHSVHDMASDKTKWELVILKVLWDKISVRYLVLKPHRVTRRAAFSISSFTSYTTHAIIMFDIHSSATHSTRNLSPNMLSPEHQFVQSHGYRIFLLPPRM